MTSTINDIVDGVSASTAVKSPVRCATTANITLSGYQTVDGVTPISTDTNRRVLVKNQTDTTENGIYNMTTNTWSRAADFDGNRDIRKGTLIPVNEGTVNANIVYSVSSADPIVIGTSNITFQTSALTSAAAAEAFADAAEASATAAATSETNAATSETNAAASETAAGISETNAQTAETNAETAETNAETAETNAAASAAAAAVSETNAAAIAAGDISGATEKLNPIAGDFLALVDSEDANILKKINFGTPVSASPPLTTLTAAGVTGVDYDADWPTLVTGNVYTARLHATNIGPYEINTISVLRPDGEAVNAMDAGEGEIMSYLYDSSGPSLTQLRISEKPNFTTAVLSPAADATKDFGKICRITLNATNDKVQARVRITYANDGNYAEYMITARQLTALNNNPACYIECVEYNNRRSTGGVYSPSVVTVTSVTAFYTISATESYIDVYASSLNYDDTILKYQFTFIDQFATAHFQAFNAETPIAALAWGVTSKAAPGVSVSGSHTTASLAAAAGENFTITHGLGTDNVFVTAHMNGSVDGRLTEVSWNVGGSVRYSKSLGPSLASVTNIGTTGAGTGEVDFRAVNRHGSTAQTITVFYKITAG